MEKKIRWVENYDGYAGFIGRRQVAFLELGYNGKTYYSTVYPTSHICVERIEKPFRSLSAAQAWCEAVIQRDWSGL